MRLKSWMLREGLVTFAPTPVCTDPMVGPGLGLVGIRGVRGLVGEAMAKVEVLMVKVEEMFKKEATVKVEILMVKMEAVAKVEATVKMEILMVKMEAMAKVEAMVKMEVLMIATMVKIVVKTTMVQLETLEALTREAPIPMAKPTMVEIKVVQILLEAAVVTEVVPIAMTPQARQKTSEVDLKMDQETDSIRFPFLHLVQRHHTRFDRV